MRRLLRLPSLPEVRHLASLDFCPASTSPSSRFSYTRHSNVHLLLRPLSPPLFVSGLPLSPTPTNLPHHHQPTRPRRDTMAFPRPKPTTADTLAMVHRCSLSSFHDLDLTMFDPPDLPLARLRNVPIRPSMFELCVMPPLLSCKYRDVIFMIGIPSYLSPTAGRHSPRRRAAACSEGEVYGRGSS